MWLYALLSVVLLFTAYIVSNIESVQQTLNITLDSAYTHVFVPVEALIWIRSLAIVLIIVSHALRHVESAQSGQQGEASAKSLHIQLSVSEQTVTAQKVKETRVEAVVPEQKALPTPLVQKRRAEENLQKVRTYMRDHPQAKAKEVGTVFSLSLPTVRKYMREVAQGK